MDKKANTYGCYHARMDTCAIFPADKTVNLGLYTTILIGANKVVNSDYIPPVLIYTIIQLFELTYKEKTIFCQNKLIYSVKIELKSRKKLSLIKFCYQYKNFIW